MPKGSLRGGPLAQAARGRGHPPGRAREVPGQGVAPLGAPFGHSESSVLHIFLYDLSGIFRALLFLTFSCNARTITDRFWHWALN